MNKGDCIVIGESTRTKMIVTENLMDERSAL